MTCKISSVVIGVSLIESILAIYKYIPRIFLFNVETLINKHGECMYYSLKFQKSGTSLAIQWLRILLPMQGTWVRSLVGELRSHMLWGK